MYNTATSSMSPTMGDVTIFLNNTSNNVGDDEEYGDEWSGSGDGVSTDIPKTTVKSDLQRSTVSGKGSSGLSDEDKSLIYIICSSLALVVVIIIIIIAIICCRRHAKAQRARKKFERNQGMSMTSSVESDRMRSRLLPSPPSTEAPLPPTGSSAKARVAPEAEKLLRAINSEPSEGLPQYEVPVFPNHYEEVGQGTRKVDAEEADKFSTDYDRDLKPVTDYDGSQMDDSHRSSENKRRYYPVAKPRKSLDNIDIRDEIQDSSLQDSTV